MIYDGRYLFENGGALQIIRNFFDSKEKKILGHKAGNQKGANP